MNLGQEKDIERLRQAALLLEQENKKLVSKVVALTRELATAKGADAQSLQLKISALEELLSQRNKALFSPSTEKRSKPKAEEKASKPQTGHGPTPQPTLPLREEIHLLDEADKVCNGCGGKLVPWDGQFPRRSPKSGHRWSLQNRP